MVDTAVKQTVREYIEHHIGYSMYKHRDEDTTNEQIEERIKEEINCLSNLELISWFDYYISDLLEGKLNV